MANNEDPINAAVSRLAQEVIDETKHVSASGDLQRPDIKQTIWNITDLFRNIIREQIQRSGMDSGAPKSMSPAQSTKDFNLSNSIIAIASYAKSELQMPGVAGHNTDVRARLAGKKLPCTS